MSHLLQIEDLRVNYGHIQALKGISLQVAEREVVAILGANGAGKTTLFNLITGLYQPSAGTVHLNGRSLAGHKPHELAPLGMCRTFQNLQICMNMGALENVMLGRHRHLSQGTLASLLKLPALRRGDRHCREQCAELMAFVGCGQYLNRHASAMPYGALKRLEIARALASEPDILLLDEPAAGLNRTETDALREVIRKIADQGITVVLVEHDMKLVMSVSDQVLVLCYGRKLADGTPEQIRANPEVIDAYLGNRKTKKEVAV
jgi:branched-chain amino acid transport system ATP-binding protein